MQPNNTDAVCFDIEFFFNFNNQLSQIIFKCILCDATFFIHEKLNKITINKTTYNRIKTHRFAQIFKHIFAIGFFVSNIPIFKNIVCEIEKI